MDEESRTCKYCWESKFSSENPLIQACLCKGGIAFIHLECCRKWQEMQRISFIQEKYQSFFWKKFECSVCKESLPLQIKAQGKTYNLAEYKKPQGDYMILESLYSEKNSSRIIHVLTPQGSLCNFKVGRDGSQDLKCKDISMSRQHSTIKF
jgi:hypothetical protein